MPWLPLVLALSALSPGLELPAGEPPGNDAAASAVAGAVAGATGLDYLGDFEVTYYWVAVEDARFDGLPRSEPLADRSGRVVAMVSTAYRRELDREGTGRLRDGRVLNVAGWGPEGRRYVLLDGASWGLGSTGRALWPHLSIAADPARLPPGTGLFLPAFECAVLPRDGEREHDGRFRVDDTGSAIRGDRIDLFIGDRALLGAAEAMVRSRSRTPVFLDRNGPSLGAAPPLDARPPG